MRIILNQNSVHYNVAPNHRSLEIPLHPIYPGDPNIQCIYTGVLTGSNQLSPILAVASRSSEILEAELTAIIPTLGMGWTKERSEARALEYTLLMSSAVILVPAGSAIDEVSGELPPINPLWSVEDAKVDIAYPNYLELGPIVRGELPLGYPRPPRLVLQALIRVRGPQVQLLTIAYHATVLGLTGLREQSPLPTFNHPRPRQPVGDQPLEPVGLRQRSD